MISEFTNFAFSNLSYLASGMTPQPGEPPARSLLSFVPMLLIFVVFFLIIIRPQMKQQKELRKLHESIKVGDRVLTSGGIFGFVSQVKEKSIVVKIAENTKIEMLRSGIQQIIPSEEKSGNKE